MAKLVCGTISKVADESPAWRAGLQAGDELLSVNSQPVRDVLDYRYLSSDPRLLIRVRRHGRIRRFSIRKGGDEELGIEFEEELFDGLRTCENNCIFCFLDQMPRGLRKSLYVKDDDYRLSLAHGNYVTLTNLTDDDVDRICRQRMSPIYVSVHATEPDLRIGMFRSTKAGRIMEQLRRLADGRITMHTQIVLCPGVNDGEHLERSIQALSSLHPWVASVAVVPVGLTRHRKGLVPLRPVESDLAREVIHRCRWWQREFQRRLGTRFVFPSDEFYLLSGAEFPEADAYEGFPQLEDGVGISRIFLDERKELAGEAEKWHVRGGHYVLVTGVLAGPLVGRLADSLNDLDGVTAGVCIVKNNFLGETVTVAGLLAGQDIAAALRDVEQDEEVLIAGVALNGDRFLDDMTICELQETVRRRVAAVDPSPRGVVEHLCMGEMPLSGAVSCDCRAGR